MSKYGIASFFPKKNIIFYHHIRIFPAKTVKQAFQTVGTVPLVSFSHQEGQSLLFDSKKEANLKKGSLLYLV